MLMGSLYSRQSTASYIHTYLCLPESDAGTQTKIAYNLKLQLARLRGSVSTSQTSD
jgi:hypothetical protein